MRCIDTTPRGIYRTTKDKTKGVQTLQVQNISYETKPQPYTVMNEWTTSAQRQTEESSVPNEGLVRSTNPFIHVHIAQGQADPIPEISASNLMVRSMAADLLPSYAGPRSWTEA